MTDRVQPRQATNKYFVDPRGIDVETTRHLLHEFVIHFLMKHITREDAV